MLYYSLEFVCKRGIEAFILLFNLLPLNESKAVMVCLDSFNLQTMTAFNQKFLQGGPDATRGQFFQKAPPLAAGGKRA
jgi:hypothetical protein